MSQLVDAEKDICIWKAAKLRTYTVAKGFKTLNEESWNAMNAKQKRIWSLRSCKEFDSSYGYVSMVICQQMWKDVGEV